MHCEPRLRGETDDGNSRIRKGEGREGGRGEGEGGESVNHGKREREGRRGLGGTGEGRQRKGACCLARERSQESGRARGLRLGCRGLERVSKGELTGGKRKREG
eukprot:2624611-Rhodomonas_salina.1